MEIVDYLFHLLHIDRLSSAAEVHFYYATIRWSMWHPFVGCWRISAFQPPVVFAVLKLHGLWALDCRRIGIGLLLLADQRTPFTTDTSIINVCAGALCYDISLPYFQSYNRQRPLQHLTIPPPKSYVVSFLY